MTPRETLPVFIIASSGRCGSTLLSEVLEQHPSVLSLSEFLVPLLMSGIRHAGQAVTAQEFCAALQNDQPTTTALLRAGITVPEFRYPFGRQGVRYRMDSGVPFPAICALAHLTDDPDSAFDILLDRVLSNDATVASDHLACTLRCLADMFGGTVVVERSGISLPFVRDLRALLPDASLVFLGRNGFDTALSMSRHAYFRHLAQRDLLARDLGYDPYTSTRRDGVHRLVPVLQDMLPERFSRAGFDALALPSGLFGALWSHYTALGLAHLPDRTPHLTYESLCIDPHAVLHRLAALLGIAPDPDWIAAATGRIARAMHPAATLPPAERDVLIQACAQGRAALAAKGFT